MHLSLSIYLYLSTVYLSLSIYLSVYLSTIAYLSIYFISIHLSICLSIYLFSVYLQDSLVPESVLEGAAKKPAPEFDGFTFVADSHLK